MIKTTIMTKTITMKKVALLIAGAAMMGGVATHVNAANWLILQGTEPAGSAPRAKLWGFLQVQYQKDYSDPNANNQYVPPKLIGPSLGSQQQFNVNRARVGIRGTGFPLDPNVNYFLLAEFGKNAITNAADGPVHVTDASITLNHINGARLRMGLFKYPGAEEALQAIHVFDYINFTSVTNQLLLERFQTSKSVNDVSDTPPQTLPAQQSLNGFDRPVGAFRDVGLQVFDMFEVGDWEHSYAVMYGNGNGLNYGDNDDNKDLYVYLSSELVLGGQGPRREGLKMFAWQQSGERAFDGDGDGQVENYDRKRMGLGVKYLQKPFRFTAEYMKGEGMIFNGPDKPSYGLVPPSAGNPAHPANGLNQEASGFTVEGGWYIPNTKWEIDLRYDVYNRLEDNTGAYELEFKTVTLGTQYHFNKKTRLTINYEIRDAEAVKFGNEPPPPPNPNINLKGVDNRASVQVTHIF